MKHFLRTASFAKKFLDPTDYETSRYVNYVKHLIVLTKIRTSKVCARSITYRQFDKFKVADKNRAKSMLNLFYKFSDYRMALCFIENLNYSRYLPQVY